MSQPRPLACSDRSGFLFAHACDRPPAGSCVRCNTPVCAEHTRSTPEGPTCVSCLRDQRRTDSSSSDSTSTSSSSSSSTAATAAAAGVVAAGTFGGAGATGAWTAGEAGSGNDPYFYGGATAAYYDADDFAAFDQAGGARAADAPETDTGAS
jgi:hypothetical protein